MNINKLKGKMAECGISQDALAAKAKMNPATLWRKLAGITEFSRDEIISISRALNLNEEEIMEIFFAAELTKTQENAREHPEH